METLFVLPSNRSIQMKSAGSNPTISDAGALLMRSVIAQTGIAEFLEGSVARSPGSASCTLPVGVVAYAVASAVDAGIVRLVDGASEHGRHIWCVHQFQTGRWGRRLGSPLSVAVGHVASVSLAQHSGQSLALAGSGSEPGD
ncbi:MAG: hypothetical protein OXD43_02655 [Bacteroidetes bacterium]|nr:hypothetical protein [Bacteroidota bacterium]